MSGRSSSSATATNPAGAVGPVRTCVGCRVRECSTELLRVVAVDGVVIPDLRRRLPGRGAWLHSDPGCLAAAERRRAFGRALRVAEPLDTNEIRVFLNDRETSDPTIGSPSAADHPSRLNQKAGRPKREHAVKQQ